MVEIYSYDITTHERFARDQQEVEAFRKQYHVPPSGSRLVAVQSKILDFVPKHSAIVLLLGLHQQKMWARFTIPDNFYLQRFASSYIAPSLGAKEKQDADIQRIKAFLKQKKNSGFVQRREPRQDLEEEKDHEAEALIELLEKGIKETNDMVDFVYARMHQFVQA